MKINTWVVQKDGEWEGENIGTWVEDNNSSSDVQHQKKGRFYNGASGINRVCGKEPNFSAEKEKFRHTIRGREPINAIGV